MTKANDITMTDDEHFVIESEALDLQDQVATLLDEVSKKNGVALVATLWAIEDCLENVRDAAKSVIARYQDKWIAGGWFSERPKGRITTSVDASNLPRTPTETIDQPKMMTSEQHENLRLMARDRDMSPMDRADISAALATISAQSDAVVRLTARAARWKALAKTLHADMGALEDAYTFAAKKDDLTNGE